IFIINLLGILYSADAADAFKDIQKQFAILLFPVLFSMSGLDIKKYKANLLKLFGFSCVLTIAYLFVYAIHTIVYNHFPLRFLFTISFLNQNFSAPLKMHATYLSMYVALSVIAFLFYFLNEKKKSNKLVYIITIIMLLAGLMQLASRAVFISTAFTIAVLYPILSLERLNRGKFFLTAILLLSIAMFSIYRIDSLKRRYLTE